MSNDRLNQTYPDAGQSQNVTELSTLLITSCPEILDSRLSDKAARSKVFALLLLNAWRRRRSDVVRCQERCKHTESLLLQVKQQKTSIESLLRYEQQRYLKLQTTAEAVRVENQHLADHLKDQCAQNAAVRVQLEANIRTAERLMAELQAAQRRLDTMTATEMELRTKIDEYKVVIGDMQSANRQLAATVTRLTDDLIVSDERHQQAMADGQRLLRETDDYRQMMTIKVASETQLREEVDALHRVCHEHRHAMEHKDAEMMRLHAMIDGALLVRLQQLARHCLMVATASIYRVSYHVWPAIAASSTSTTVAAVERTLRCDDRSWPVLKNTNRAIPFVVAAPLLTVKTMSK